MATTTVTAAHKKSRRRSVAAPLCTATPATARLTTEAPTTIAV